MYRHTLFITWALLLVVIATLHLFALKYSLYFAYPWFDIMIHFLGGVFVALSATWFFFESNYVHVKKNAQNVLLVVGGSIVCVGIGWEIFKILAGIAIEENFFADTVTDLFMDALGAFLGGFIFVRMYIKNTTSAGDEMTPKNDKNKNE